MEKPSKINMLWKKNDILLNDRLMVLMTSSNPDTNTVPKKTITRSVPPLSLYDLDGSPICSLKKVLLSFVLISQGCHNKYYKLGGLKQQECILSPSQQTLGETPSLPLPASTGSQISFSCGSIAPVSASVFTRPLPCVSLCLKSPSLSSYKDTPLDLGLNLNPK